MADDYRNLDVTVKMDIGGTLTDIKAFLNQVPQVQSQGMDISVITLASEWEKVRPGVKGRVTAPLAGLANTTTVDALTAAYMTSVLQTFELGLANMSRYIQMEGFISQLSFGGGDHNAPQTFAATFTAQEGFTKTSVAAT